MVKVPTSSSNDGDKAREELRKFSDEIRKAAESSNKLGQELQTTGRSVGRLAGAAAGAGGAFLGSSGGSDPIAQYKLIVSAIETAGAALAAKAESAIGKAVGEGVREIGSAMAGPLQVMQVQQRASAAVSSQLAPFAAAGLPIPSEVLQRGAAFETTRAERLVKLERDSLAAVRYQQILDGLRRFHGFGFGG